jgi:hypothetical protein
MRLRGIQGRSGLPRIPFWITASQNGKAKCGPSQLGLPWGGVDGSSDFHGHMVSHFQALHRSPLSGEVPYRRSLQIAPRVTAFTAGAFVKLCSSEAGSHCAWSSLYLWQFGLPEVSTTHVAPTGAATCAFLSQLR